MVLAVDARRSIDENAACWEVCTHGGRKPTGINVLNWIEEAVGLGAGEILLTSWDADGHRAGYDNELNRAASELVEVPVIASGGAGTLEHLYQALSLGKADAVLADEDCQVAPDIICVAARTGREGDGMIFVLPVENAMLVRTSDNDDRCVTGI